MSQQREPSQRSDSADAAFADLVAELTDCLQAGQPLEIERHIAAHPEWAERLRNVLPALEVMADANASGGDEPPAGERGPGTLGDFRIVREVGRGGMGVVYEAEQISLDRRVALKVLPFASTMDSRHLQRFQNEARAAAGLHHTNIVPVHFVGSERGVHYYAMQFIEGRNLADVIADLRTQAGGKPTDSKNVTTVDAAEGAPTTPAAPSAVNTRPIAGLSTEGSTKSREYFRAVARLGIQAAEALDHAHQLGIVHRDVKPANLLVDDGGRLWVADFGLAQIQSDTRLTMTGDLVGTLRYMSPEQALAKRVVVDHRTDIYSLGTTLYELLTLEPAFNGRDHQELLRQIAFEEPRRPRRLNRAIPQELETIVLKAMERNPADRYATAENMADDLRNFLEDRAIRARRPSLLNRFRRWRRQHKSLMIVLTFLSLILSLLGGVGLWFLLWQQQQLAVLEQAVGEDVREADLLQEQERWPEALQKLERASGRLTAGAPRYLHERVEERRKNVTMIAMLDEARYQNFRDGVLFDREVADRAYAAAFEQYGLNLEKLEPEEAAQRIRKSTIRSQLVAALDHWASVRRAHRPGSEERLQVVARLADDDPWRQQLRDPKVLNDPVALSHLAAEKGILAQAPSNLALLYEALLRVHERATALRLLRQMQQTHPADFLINWYLAGHLYQDRATRSEAHIYLRVAVALRPRNPLAHDALGVTLRTQNKPREAEAAFRKAIEFNPNLASAHFHLAGALLDQDKNAEALAECKNAIALIPGDANAYARLGICLAKQKKFPDAEEAFRKAIELNPDCAEAYENLAILLGELARFPEAVDSARKAVDLNPENAMAYYNLGVALRGNAAEAVAAYRRAVELDPSLALAWNGLGFALFTQQKPADAVVALQKAIDLDPGDARYHLNLGIALKAIGRLDEAIGEYREAIRLKKDVAEAHNNLGIALHAIGRLDEAIDEYREAIRINKDYVEAHCNLGSAFSRKGKLEEAIAEFRDAIRLKKDSPEPYFNLGIALEMKGQFTEALGYYRRGHELGSKNPHWPYPSAQLVQNCERLIALDGKLPAILSGEKQPFDTSERLALAELCQMPCKKQYAAAQRFYSEAFATEPKRADDLNAQHRYNAACAAALAGCGQGEGADKLDEQERARLRQQTLDWLRADLKAYRQAMDKAADKAGPAVAQRMQHWLQDADLAGVHGPDALAKLPEAERQEWQKLWDEVEALRQRAAKPLAK
jgi:serine/threonine protein kinase/Flp pilus assembly protein TadD